MSTQSLNRTPLKVPRFEEQTDKYFINKNWYIVRNDKNWRFEGPWWQKYFYSLNYVPAKCFTDPGFHEEMKDAEDTKKKIVDYVSMSFFAVCFICTPGMIQHIYSNLTKTTMELFFLES